MRKYMCLISVIVPLYNREQYIKNCLMSLCNQTLKNIEIILVDDGSTDHGGSICEALAKEDPRLKVVHIANSGAAAARNYAMKLARGEYIMFLDSDDCYLPDYCERMYEGQKKYGDKAMCMSGIKFIKYTTGEIVRESSVEKKEEVLDRTDLLLLYKKGILNVACNKLYKNSIIKRFAIIEPEKWKQGEDTMFVYQYLQKAEIEQFVVLNETYYKANVHESESLSKTYYRNYYETFIELFQKLEDVCEQYRATDEAILEELFWDIIQYSLKNTMKKENRISWYEKIKENDKILAEEIVKKYLQKEKNILGKWQHRVYRTQRYVIVLLYETAYKVLKA